MAFDVGIRTLYGIKPCVFGLSNVNMPMYVEINSTKNTK